MESFQSAKILQLAKFEWAREFVGMDILQIEGAIRKVNSAALEFPPSLPVFLKYCREMKEKGSNGLPTGYRYFGGKA